MENRHQPGDLKQLQSLPLDAKIELTKERIRVWYESWTRFEILNLDTGKTRFETFDMRDRYEPPIAENEFVQAAWPGAVYVSFSGGKDSTVLKHIVDQMYDDVPAVFVNTGLEYPEIQKFARSQKNVTVIRPEMRFDQVVKNYGYPVVSKRVSSYANTARRLPNSQRAKWLRGEEWTKFVTGGKWDFLVDADFWVSAKCCDIMKKQPFKKYATETGRLPIIGTLACESLNREQAWVEHGCNAFEAKEPKSQPLSFWTEQDVLHYIKKFGVPYCSAVYGDIQVKPYSGEDVSDGQMNIIDFLGCYEPEDVLHTTGCDRTGCVFCAFGCHRQKEPNRFQQLKKTHPRQYEYCIGGGEMVDGKWQPSKDGLGLGHVLDYIGVKY